MPWVAFRRLFRASSQAPRLPRRGLKVISGMDSCFDNERLRPHGRRGVVSFGSAAGQRRDRALEVGLG